MSAAMSIVCDSSWKVGSLSTGRSLSPGENAQSFSAAGAQPRSCVPDAMIEPWAAIREVIRSDWARPVSEAVWAVNEALKTRHKETVGAVLFYGSRLSPAFNEGVSDLCFMGKV